MTAGVSWDQPPAPDRLSEQDLFRGLRGAREREVEVREVRSEPCACGGVIRTAIDAPAFIAQMVRAHQQSARHRAWWRAMEANS